MTDKIKQLRVFPRAFAIFYLYCMGYSFFWFMDLTIPSNAQAAFVSALSAAGAAFFKFYVETGNDS